MKKLIFIYSVLMLPWASPAQEGSAFIDLALSQLHLNRAKCLEQFLLAQPVSGSEYLVVIPEITAIEREDSYTMRGHVLIVESYSGRIVARNTLPTTWYSDAFYLYQIEILDKSIACSDGKPSYGLLLSYSVRSQPNPYDTSLLSVWVRQGDKLVEVLTEYPTYISRGETNAANAGEFEVHNRSLSALPAAGKDYYDLKVVDSLRRFEYNWDVSSEERILEQAVILDTLSFQPASGKYSWE